MSQLEENANEVYTYLNTERELVATTLIELLGAGATATGRKENAAIITAGVILCVAILVGAALA
ncbi:MAG: hypothetical protein ABF875_08015 [Liquorilactobacillus nagelii]